MKKYNLSEIMKRAWEMHKSYRARSLTFGECLKRAWSEAKEALEVLSQVGQNFKNGMEIKAFGYERTLSRWTKGNMDRVYINGGSKSGDGFVDIKSGRTFLRGNAAYQEKMAEIILSMVF